MNFSKECVSLVRPLLLHFGSQKCCHSSFGDPLPQIIKFGQPFQNRAIVFDRRSMLVRHAAGGIPMCICAGREWLGNRAHHSPPSPSSSLVRSLVRRISHFKRETPCFPVHTKRPQNPWINIYILHTKASQVILYVCGWSCKVQKWRWNCSILRSLECYMPDAKSTCVASLLLLWNAHIK